MAPSHIYPKRRRLNKRCFNRGPSYKSFVNILDLPPENIQQILQWIPCTDLVAFVKLVSKFFRDIVNELLFRKFLDISKQLEKLNESVYNFIINLPENQARKNVIQVLASIEIIIQQYKLLESSILRYLYQRRSEVPLCYCFAKILDLFDYIFVRLYNRNGEFSVASRYSRALKNLIRTVKSFIFHFERHTEFKMNSDCYVSGAKICDILDSCMFADREVLYENYDNGTCNIKVRYDVPDSWFIVLPTEQLSKPDPKIWQEQQRLMYLRLRRLLSTHGAQQIDLIHWFRSTPFSILEMFDLPKAANCVYNGYGEHDEELFFYGNCNTGGYNCKVRRLEHREPFPDEHDFFKLEITVELKCSLEHAPLEIFKQHCLHFDKKQPCFTLRRSSRLQKAFQLKINFNTSQPRKGPSYLPTTYDFEVSEERRLALVEKTTSKINSRL